MKLMYDEACLGEASDFGELADFLSNYDNSSFIGSEDEDLWKEAVLQEIPNLFSLGYNTNDVRLTLHTCTQTTNMCMYYIIYIIYMCVSTLTHMRS